MKKTILFDTDYIVFVIGLPASGKTFYTDFLKNDNPNYRVIHTDDYIKFGRTEELAECVKDIQRAGRKKERIIVEGVLCYRILKSFVLQPDTIIVINASRDERVERYKTRPTQYSREFDGMLIRLWKDYVEHCDWEGIRMPNIIQIGKL